MMDDCQCRQQKNTNYVMRTEGQDGLFGKVGRMFVILQMCNLLWHISGGYGHTLLIKSCMERNMTSH